MAFFSPTSESAPCFLEYPTSSQLYASPVPDIRGKLCPSIFGNENPRDIECKILYASHRETTDTCVKTILSTVFILHSSRQAYKFRYIRILATVACPPSFMCCIIMNEMKTTNVFFNLQRRLHQMPLDYKKFSKLRMPYSYQNYKEVIELHSFVILKGSQEYHQFLLNY